MFCRNGLTILLCILLAIFFIMESEAQDEDLMLLPQIPAIPEYVVQDQFTSPSLEGNLLGDPATRDVLVYLPPSYDTSPEKCYPTIYVLHGYSGDHRMYVGVLNAHIEAFAGVDLDIDVDSIVKELLANGQMAEAIIVLPDAVNIYGGSWFERSEVLGDYRDYIARDLVEYIDSKYRTIPDREHRGLTGHSMGGYGALSLAIEYPDVFGSVAALSPAGVDADADIRDLVMVAPPEAMANPTVVSRDTLDEDLWDLFGATFYESVSMSMAAAFSPNPDNPPFYADLPVDFVDGETVLVEEIAAKWRERTLVNQISVDGKNLSNTPIFIDNGVGEVTISPEVTNIDLIPKALSDQNLSYVYDTFPGDHLSHLRYQLSSGFAFLSSHISAQSPVDEAEEEILAIMKAMDDAYRIPDADMVVSHYAEDAIIDCPPYEPYGKEGDREFLQWLFETYPTFSLANAHYLASGTEKVGIAEHSSIWIFPDTGIPYDGYHICAHDFDEGKMTRLNCYIDYATEQIQSGAMPPRNLGDMIASFELPASEPTGLDPMEASSEFIERLNSHDLVNFAKMIRHDVDAWFSFIGRTASRYELIDIHEQMLGGFSDMGWENTRRVDMGDGWVFSEVKLIGTNDGEFLGKAATGLPMEVRAGLIEHYDEDGLADYVHFHFDTLSVPGQGMPEGPVEDFSNVFFMELTAGLNMISLPLKPQTPHTARSLAEEIGATVVIKYDEAQGRFMGFTPASSGDGFAIEGGKGYIVNVLEGKTFACTGKTWTNEPSAEAAPPSMSESSGWAFVVSVAMTDHQGYDYTVTVRNLRTGEVAKDNIRSGRSNAVFADLNRSPVIKAGDRVEIIIRDSANRVVAGPVTHQIDQDDIRKAFKDMVIPYGYARPEKTVLLQNYPNPFNPETWIPFHLSKEADVSVSIYDSTGRLVRSLALGRKSEGIYTDKSKAAYWDGRNNSGETVASGVYYYSIAAGDFSATRKMIVKK